MIEAFALSIFFCSAAPQAVGDCAVFVPGSWFETEEDCYASVIDRTIPWAQRENLMLIEAECIRFELPLPEGDPT